MSKRPRLVHFISILTDDFLSIRASLSVSTKAYFEFFDGATTALSQLLPTKPIESLGLLRSQEFRIKIVAFDENDQEILNRDFDSDSFGNFTIRIPLNPAAPVPRRVLVYESLSHPGVEVLLGSFIPQKLENPKKVIITDFDKTLVDTKYSSAREVMISLRNPVSYFPIVESSVDLFKKFVQEGYHSFIVSASPHFYENAIRDWLYQNGLFTGNIFLKDYRSIFSFFSGELSTKDLKNQGFYKLNQIVTILLMTGIPEDLILVGDGFESDTLIYLALASVLIDRADPWMVWNTLKEEEAFRLTNQQHTHFLSKFFQLKNLVSNKKRSKVSIYIRCKQDMVADWQQKSFPYDYLNRLKKHVTFYVG
jgi:hypothetical protein